jgi:hypothetical protein
MVIVAFLLSSSSSSSSPKGEGRREKVIDM